MEALQIILLSITSLVVLFILTKIMGHRQISEMSFFDYVIGITIGSIAAEMATNIDLDWWKGILAMAIYALVGVGFSAMSMHSIKARGLISGKPILLIERGKIIKRNLKKARIEINDLLTSARTNGYFDLSDIDYAVMETTGKISFLPVPLKRPLAPQDFNFYPTRDGLFANVIIDGKIMSDDLQKSPATKKQLLSAVEDSGKKLQDVILATVDENGKIKIF